MKYRCCCCYIQGTVQQPFQMIIWWQSGAVPQSLSYQNMTQIKTNIGMFCVRLMHCLGCQGYHILMCWEFNFVTETGNQLKELPLQLCLCRLVSLVFFLFLLILSHFLNTFMHLVFYQGLFFFLTVLFSVLFFFLFLLGLLCCSEILQILC